MRYVIFLLLLIAALGCQKEVGPEHAAVVSGRDFAFCGACGGWIVYVVEGTDSTMYRADIPAPFDKNNTPVLIRYERDLSDGLKDAGRWIKIHSIRSRK